MIRVGANMLILVIIIHTNEYCERRLFLARKSVANILMKRKKKCPTQTISPEACDRMPIERCTPNKPDQSERVVYGVVINPDRQRRA